MAQHGHCLAGERKHAQPEDDMWSNHSIFPVFALGDDPFGWIILFVMSTGDDIDLDTVDVCANFGTISPPLQRVSELAFEPTSIGGSTPFGVVA
jgi:hypothetical protein